MSVAGMTVIDLDSHLVDEMKQWDSFIEERWKPFLPKPLPTEPDERRHTLVGKRIMIGSELTRHFEEKRNWHRPEDLTPEGRVQNIDKEGIDIAALTPSPAALDVLWFVDDPQLAAAYCRAENNYMDHYASKYPERLKWAGVIPLQDREEAIKELDRAAKMGMKGVTFKAVPVNGRKWEDPYYDPVYREVQALRLPLVVHDTKTASLGQERYAENFFFSHIVGRVLETMVCCMSFICGGVLERFPQLKVIFVEMGAAQAPWWLERMDSHYEKLPYLVPWLKMKPSDYFRRQVFLGCEPYHDTLIETTVECLGDGNLVLTSDYPHWDALQPGSQTRAIVESPRLSEKSKRKILSENAAAILQ